ncbi:coproporphyrinogen dehydrogenase HemZ [Pseudoramibacter faecis]|uniref:coproporphyrinogen dehydrogenase HemZ n=1 Tax=Pseudoramibacter faecis TaxID=3108534 RepID=UPI002E766188|nr:coproporphyrinogen dehydrogenase HemZ [Pseudoramibacter sp. HA2172]
MNKMTTQTKETAFEGLSRVKTVCLVMPDHAPWRTAARELLMAYLPDGDIQFDGEADAIIRVVNAPEGLTIAAAIFDRPSCERTFEAKADETPDSERFKTLFYHFLKDLFNKTLAWGSLTGIKPVKIAHHYMAGEGLNREQAGDKMMRVYDVSVEKAALAAEIAHREMPIVYPLNDHLVSVYVGIPICPAKCSYCSFVSTIADKKGMLCADYLQGLISEIRQMGAWMIDQQLRVDTLYIGGGTPSVLSADQIGQLLAALKESRMIHPKLREFTFEAGRPETTTPEKLAVLKAFGVNRLCLNPQSMNDETLAAIGRFHTAADIERVYRQIRDVGFDCVNMDLIAGLNQETPAQFLTSLDRVVALRPENLTVHSLAIKKGSRMKAAGGHHYTQLYDAAFYDQIHQKLAAAGYEPYYMYRQKYAQGNGENIGYCLTGHPGIYNTLMMAEKQTIIGIGAGSSGKVYHAQTDRFNKVFTVKDIRTYNQRGQQVIDQKLTNYQNLIDQQ